MTDIVGRRSGWRAGDVLLRRIAVGDRDAFAALYDQLGSAVYAVAAHHRVGAQRAVDEVVMATFTRIWRTAPRYIGQDLTADAWILGVIAESIAVGMPIDPESGHRSSAQTPRSR